MTNHIYINCVKNINAKPALIIYLLILILNLYNPKLAVSFELPEATTLTPIKQQDNLLFSKEEELLGTIVRRSLISADFSENNLVVNEYLNNLGKSLLIYIEQIKLKPLHFFVIPYEEINACTLMGGNIGIFAGIINFTANESELAAILAHEIGHVTQQHFTREAAYQKRLLPITLIEAITATMLGIPDLILPILGQHLNQSLAFSRNQEKEADHVGIKLLQKSAFNPIAMPTIFNKMSKLQLDNVNNTNFGATHPMFSTRINATYNRIKPNKYQQYQNSIDYKLIKVIIELSLNTNKRQLLETMHQLPSNACDDLSCRYQNALLMQHLHKYNDAMAILSALAAEYPSNFLLQNSLAQILLYTNKELAVEKLATLYSLVPDKLSTVINYAKALIGMNLYQQAKNILTPLSKNILAELLEEPKIYQLLMACCQKLELSAESLYHQAKLLIINNQLDLSKEKLLLALNLAKKYNNPVLAQQIIDLQQQLEEFIQTIKNIKP